MAAAKRKEVQLSDDLGEIADSAHGAADFLKALAHESRLLILCLLCQGEKSVSELESLLSQRQSTVSQQLARLRLEGLVSYRRDGKSIYYNLANDDVRTILKAVYDVFCAKRGSSAKQRLRRHA